MKKRSFVKWLVLSVVTLGIYNLYWIHKLAKDVNKICEGDGKKTSGLLQYILLGIVTLGIYDFAWLFMTADRMADIAPKYNAKVKGNSTVILLSLIFFSPITIYLIIENMNALVEEYNKKPLAIREKDNIERTLLSFAKQNKGIVSPIEASLEINMSIDEVKQCLDGLVSKGIAKIGVRKSGVMVYTIPEFIDSKVELENF